MYLGVSAPNPCQEVDPTLSGIGNNRSGRPHIRERSDDLEGLRIDDHSIAHIDQALCECHRKVKVTDHPAYKSVSRQPAVLSQIPPVKGEVGGFGVISIEMFASRVQSKEANISMDI